MRTLLIVLLVQTVDVELARLEEWSKTQPDSGPGRIGIGDEYYKSSKKFPKDRQRFMDHANESWSKGWPDLDTFWKDKTRENLRKIYAVSGASHAVTGWKTEKVSVTGECVHSGAFAVKIPMVKGEGYVQPLKYDVKLPPSVKELEVSAWVLSDGTESSQDDMKPHITDGTGKILSSSSIFIPMDLPVWTQIKAKVQCEGAAKCLLYFEFQSRKGTVYVDDVSVKVDGKELVRDGGFEGK